MSGLKLSKPVVDALCKLAGSLTLSGLLLGGTGIGTVSKTYFLLLHFHVVISLLFNPACLAHMIS